MDDGDPLLPQLPYEIEVPPGLDGEDRLKYLFEAVRDHVNLHALAWPAKDSSGQLVPPPDEHVLDHLARSNDLVDEERALTTLGAETVNVLGELPECDLCNLQARYDGRITLDAGEAGAFMCPICYVERGSGTLGASGDVYLMLMDEVPVTVQRVCNRMRAQQQKPPLFT